ALGIATPVAVSAGLALAARRGVVVRAAPVLERVADAARVAFDKTGTLTDGTPRLVEVRVAADAACDERTLLARVAALESGLAHPLARACVAAAGERGCPALVAREVRVVPGRGVRGRVAGQELFVGEPEPAERRAALDALGIDGGTAGDTLALVRSGDRVLAALRFAERLRDGARAAVRELRALGVRASVLSGDRSVSALVPTLVDPSEVACGLLPEDKVARIRALRGELRRGESMLMVGDGINDAPALAAADVGIAVADATDLARLTADVVVLGGDPAAVAWLVRHARAVRRVARQNLAWAFAYNGAAVALAVAGALTPLVAALAMLASSFAVLANARRLGRVGGRARRSPTTEPGEGAGAASRAAA
ncbi:MAG: HAD-IC family P-type ATPase, partial [Thermodesulfobacteriota bacterium]